MPIEFLPPDKPKDCVRNEPAGTICRNGWHTWNDDKGRPWARPCPNSSTLRRKTFRDVLLKTKLH